jgi:dolichol kinase
MTYGDEVRRKLIHLASAIIPLVYWATDRRFMLSALVPLVAIAIVVELLRHYNRRVRGFIQRWLGRVVREAEAHAVTGATYVTLASLLTIAIFPKPFAITALLFLAVCDALASLIGIRFGRTRYFGKSLVGSAAFFLSASAIALLALRGMPLVALAGALVGTIVEALPLKIGRYKLDDNLVIPLTSAAAMWALQAVLH